MSLEFYNPPLKIFSSSSTKKGVEIGGAKSIISIDSEHNFYNEGNIYTEMSWAAFYEEEGLEDSIDTFTTTEFDSIREDPEALKDTIVKTIYQIINNRKIFYGIADFEVSGFSVCKCRFVIFGYQGYSIIQISLGFGYLLTVCSLCGDSTGKDSICSVFG